MFGAPATRSGACRCRTSGDSTREPAERPQAVPGLLAAVPHQGLDGVAGGLGSSPAQASELTLGRARQVGVDDRLPEGGRRSSRLARSSRRTRPAATSPAPSVTSVPTRTPRSRSTRRASASRCRSPRWRRSSSTTDLAAASDITPTRSGLEPAKPATHPPRSTRAPSGPIRREPEPPRRPWLRGPCRPRADVQHPMADGARHLARRPRAAAAQGDLARYRAGTYCDDTNIKVYLKAAISARRGTATVG